MDSETKIYRIPDCNYESFIQRFTRLERRAAKLGCGSVAMKLTGTEDWPGYSHWDGDTGVNRTSFYSPEQAQKLDPERYSAVGYSRRYYLVTVTGDAPKLNGWEFLGSLELVFDENGKSIGQMVRTVPGKEMPVEYRDAAVWCDHCKANRRWHSTFVVRHEDGTTKQVGRNCLRDFTGHQSPEAVASMATLLADLTDLADCAEDDDWGFGGGHGKRYYDVETLLQKTSAIIRRDGWAPKAFEHPTAETLQGWVYSRDNDLDRFSKRYPIEDVDRITAEQAIEWMTALADKPKASDYEHNLSLLGRAGTIESKSFGFLASAIPSYMRAHDAEVTRKNEAAVSQYVGEVKQRIEMVLTLVRVIVIDTQWGSMSIIKFIDESGNIIIWKTGSDPRIANDTKMRVKATVSKQDEYRGCKQTEVKRLSVVEVISAPVVTPPVMEEANAGN